MNSIGHGRRDPGFGSPPGETLECVASSLLILQGFVRSRVQLRLSEQRYLRVCLSVGEETGKAFCCIVCEHRAFLLSAAVAEQGGSVATVAVAAAEKSVEGQKA